jgi:very-short-patch-repair endonuclease
LVLHPDLADPVLRIALDAEGFEWHGKSAALTRDCRRYNTLGLLGWQVIRFSWFLVMRDAAYVHRTLVAAVAVARQHANVA